MLKIINKSFKINFLQDCKNGYSLSKKMEGKKAPMI
jgi:hypothetical protein